MKTISAEIKQCRIDRGLTQAELANYAGVQHNQICNFENGKNNLTLKTIFKILEVMGLTLKTEKRKPLE